MRARRRLPGLLAAGVAGALAVVGSLGAGSAMAASACKETLAINGQGSSLQTIAQELWIAGSECKVTYTTSGSGAGRTVWGAEKPGNKPNDGKKENPAESGDSFVASDEPLSITQMTNLDEAAGGKYSAEDTGKEGQTVVVPVAQAAVAVIVNLPSGCSMTEITNEQLQKVWNTEITNWSEISTGTGCAGEIKRVTRHDVSGTTFVFKTYLNEINKGTLCDSKTWKTLSEPANNTEWPECKGPKVMKPTESGGGKEAELVAKTADSIGYANLGDARKQYKSGGSYKWLKVENQNTATFVQPGIGSKEPEENANEANCSGTHYGQGPSKATADDDWSAVNGAHPGNGTETNENYPICTLTYDVGLVSYAKAAFAEPKDGNVAEEYLHYVVEGGQSTLPKHDYGEIEPASVVGKLAKELAVLIAGGAKET